MSSLPSAAQLLRVAPLIVVRVIGAVLAGALAVYVARTQGAEASGRFFYLVSTLTITSVITRLGAEPYLTSQVAARGRQDARSGAAYLVSTMVAASILVLVAGLVLSVVQLVSPPLTDRVLGDVPVYALVLAVMGLNTVWIVTGYCRARGKAGISIFLETGLLSLWLLGVLELCRFTSLEPSGRNVALALSLMCPALLAPLAPLLYGARHRLFTIAGIKDALAGIGSFAAVTVTNSIVILIPLQVLGWFGKVHEAGIYNAGFRVSMFVGAFGVVVKSLIVRREIDRTDQVENRRRDVLVSGVMALPWVALSLLLTWQGQLLSALFGSEFSELGRSS